MKKAFYTRAIPQKNINLGVRRRRQHGDQWLQTEKPETEMPTKILLLLAQLHTETIKVGKFRSAPFSGSRGDAITM